MTAFKIAFSDIGTREQASTSTRTRGATAGIPKKCAVIQSATYTSEERSRAERMKIVLELMYNNAVAITYRKNFIALRIVEPKIKVAHVQKLALLELDYKREGVTKDETRYETIYRIARK